MMHRSKIEWVLNPDNKTLGYTWNPITGCLNGCEYCYARKLAYERLKERYLANNNTAPRFYGEQFVKDILVMNDPFYPRFWEDRLRELDPIWKMKHFTVGGASKVQPKGIFVCDMSDLFGIGIPESWTRQVMDVIRTNSQHRFYLLTKQPQNLARWSPFPPNCYVGVSVTKNNQLANAVKYLKEVAATVKFISFEPLLEQIKVA